MMGASPEIRPKQQPRILESPKRSVGEQKFPDRYSKNATLLQKTDSPRAKRRVHCGHFGESNWQVLESTYLFRQIVQENCGFLPCISDADRFACFPCLHGSVCSVPKKYDKAGTQIFRPWWRCHSPRGRVLAIRLWATKSTCSVQRRLAHRIWNHRWP